MNRGFFRLWVVLTFVWIGLVGKIAYTSVWAPHQLSAHCAREYDKEQAAKSDPKAPFWAKDPLVECEGVNQFDQFDPLWPQLAPFAGFGFGVPAGLLIFFAAVAWVIRGFRPIKTSSK
jgi:hypothetical protein